MVDTHTDTHTHRQNRAEMAGQTQKTDQKWLTATQRAETDRCADGVVL